MKVTPESLLVRARALVDRGWRQGSFSTYVPATRTTHYCALGAIGKATEEALNINLDRTNPETSLRAIIAVDHRAKAVLADVIGSPSIACWNDRPGRTKEEVVAAFDKAIDKLREE